MRRILFLAAGALAIAGPAHAMHPSPLVEAEWLDQQLGSDDLVVLDVRSSIDDGGDRDTFEAARIPGSRYSNYTDAGWREDRDEVAGLLPDVEDLEALIGGLGIGNGDTVVIVPAGTGPTDWFVLSELGGFEEVALYDGSMAEWTASDSRPVQLADRGTLAVGELLE